MESHLTRVEISHFDSQVEKRNLTPFPEWAQLWLFVLILRMELRDKSRKVEISTRMKWLAVYIKCSHLIWVEIFHFDIRVVLCHATSFVECTQLRDTVHSTRRSSIFVSPHPTCWISLFVYRLATTFDALDAKQMCVYSANRGQNTTRFIYGDYESLLKWRAIVSNGGFSPWFTSEAGVSHLFHS